MDTVEYIDFRRLAKELDVRRGRIFEWCRVGLLPARKPTAEERKLVVFKNDRVYLKRRMFGLKESRTRREWVEAFLAVVTRE